MISAILLAAGESKRMKDENKLIKEINGLPLIKHAVKNILGSAIDELIIVLGHEKEVIKIMRANLNRKSYLLWKKRVRGRVTKHRKLFKSRFLNY